MLLILYTDTNTRLLTVHKIVEKQELSDKVKEDNIVVVKTRLKIGNYEIGSITI